jgi:hypothetical protein
MKRVTLSILLILTVAGAYALGRISGIGAGSDESGAEPGGSGPEPDLSSLASFRASLELPDALERSYRFNGFLLTLSSDEVGEASQVIESRGPWLVEAELLNFMLAWTRFDAPAAFEWALSRSGLFQQQALAAALEAWAFHDPAAARRALVSVDPHSRPIPLGEFLVKGWLKGGQGQRDGVMEFILEQEPGTTRQRYTNLLTIELMRDGPDAVVRWAEAIPDDAPGSYKTIAFQKAANILATVDPVYTSRWIEAHLGQGYADGAPSVIGRRWLEIDPPAALAWLSSLPRGDVNDEALAATLRIWLGEAPEAAEAWVRSSSEAGGGGSAIEVMIDLHAEDPPTAIGWAQRIADPAERFRAIVRLGRAWHRREPEASKEWIEASELPPRMRSAMLAAPAAQPRSAARGVPPAGGAAPVPAS